MDIPTIIERALDGKTLTQLAAEMKLSHISWGGRGSEKGRMEKEMADQSLLQKAEEHGQARELKAQEVWAFALLAALKSVIMTAAIGLIVGGLCWEALGARTTLLIVAIIGATQLGFNLLADLDTLIDGLRSYRSAQTYTPPQAEPIPVVPPSPILVNPYKKSPYLLGRGDEETPALPDGRNTKLALNPPSVSAILKEVVKQHGGQWSRNRLMSIRVNGQRVTRSLYEELTDAFARAGFLQERPSGGFELPPDVQEFDDLYQYLPGLIVREGGNPTGRAGGKAGRQETGGQKAIPPDGRAGGTLAEQRRQKFLELNCDVVAYLDWRDGNDS